MIIILDKFEGPLSLLLKLIESEEMDITTISLAKIADDYIAYIKAAKDINPEEVADFLVVAAKLLLIKSRALLPYLYPTQDEEVDDFEAQIKMYKEFLDASRVLGKLATSGRRLYTREFSKPSWLKRQPKFTAPVGIDQAALKMVFEDLLSRLRPVEKIDETTIEDHINIEDKIAVIKATLLNKTKFYFSRFVSEARSKTEIVVGFLAVLELMKQQDVLIEQVELFGEIEVTSCNQ